MAVLKEWAWWECWERACRIRCKLERRCRCRSDCDSYHLGALLRHARKGLGNKFSSRVPLTRSVTGIGGIVDEFSTVTGKSKVYRTRYEGQKWEDSNMEMEPGCG